MKKINISIASHLLTLPSWDYVRISEIMYHFIIAEMHDESARYYADSSITGLSLLSINSVFLDFLLNKDLDNHIDGFEWIKSWFFITLSG